MTAPPPPTAPPSNSGGPTPTTPNAERFLLDSDNLRRRQLRSALLHGSGRVWRERRRIWPAVVGGIIVVAVIAAAIAVYAAFRRQQAITEEQQHRALATPSCVIMVCTP